MIDEAVFWQLMRAVGRDGDVERLVARLAGRPQVDITGFEDRLAALLWALDTPAHFAAARPIGADGFLYVRCAVVAAGRKAYERVARTPSALSKFVDREAEVLLTVAGKAYERATGLLWEHEPPLSYETGSNVAAWGDNAPEEVTDEEPGELAWLEFAGGSAIPGGLPRAYDLIQTEILDAVIADPAWRRWWAGAGVPTCELWLMLDGMDSTPAEASVKKGRKRVRVTMTRDPGPIPVNDPAAMLALVTGDLRDLFELAREQLGLGPPPPLPEPSLDGIAPEFFRPGPEEDEVPLPPGLLERLERGEYVDPEEAVALIEAHVNADGDSVKRVEPPSP
ncbi:DUF4240 domain-containing protein [Paractinoplanes atraurantiacus]|uniref:DUF4240 domain-containing protein n=1 Tax=Paractinoplanes atraurantiacus TaxID=1036182 RepID=A0A285KCI6_9ACTN|nr:DUF4240 domain-containing protein [Actinoplanes atraurantiacus]SNY70315.1 Protein of unknown function [Actinoplanes atraurantiacus]